MLAWKINVFMDMFIDTTCNNFSPLNPLLIV